MNELKKARETYEAIEIPTELNETVQNAIAKTSSIQEKSKKSIYRKHRRIYQIGISVAAALLVTIIVGLNTSRSFAMEMQKLPVVGGLAKVLTIRSYETQDENAKISVEVPAIVEENTNAAPTPAITDINAEIERIANTYVEEAKEIVADYKKAFLETGGTEEEWEEHDIEIHVDYEIKSQTDTYVSLIFATIQNWAGAYNEVHYYNLDLMTGNKITLKDLLGENYIALANASILAQMQERTEEGAVEYFGKEMDGFTTITDETKFYINEAGNPVIVFEKYEIAPGAYGPQEFEIQK